jgi:uncharacterized membrane protein
MSELVAIAYPDEHQAADVMETIKRLHADGVITLEDAAALSKNGEGAMKVEGVLNRTKRGAAGGLFLGTVIGALFLVPVAGAIFGTAAGALAGKMADVSHIDDFMLQVGDNMPPGSSAILLLATKADDPDTALAELGQFGGQVIRTTLPDDAEARIRAALAQPGADTP